MMTARQRRTTHCLAAAATVAMIVLVELVVASAQGTPSPGQATYSTLGCAGCHGPAGKGTATGPALVPMAATVQAFVNGVRKPMGTMPAYAKAQVSDADLAQVHAHLRSLAPAAGTASASGGATPPRGDAENGKKLYTTIGCWQCHGYAGQGGSAGPKIGPSPIAYPAFTAALRRPRSDMPPYTAKVVPDQQVADLYAYVQTLAAPPDPETIAILKRDPR